MALKGTRFKVDDAITLGGKPMRVAGLVQFEAPDAKVSTRYNLAAAAGSSQVLEDDGERLSLLRPFPSSGQPEPSGDTVSVMGAKYKLAAVRKLKVLGTAGQAPAGAGGAALLLSGVFQGAAGSLLREMAPGQPGQSFYSVKALAPGDILDAAQVAAQAQVAQLAAQKQAEADDEDGGEESGGIVKKAVSWIVTILVMVGLGFACSDESGDDSSPGSARSSFHGGSRGK